MAQSDRTAIYRFLDMSPNASIAGLGGYHPGLFEPDFSNMHLNPAYLHGSETGMVSATFINFFGDSKMGNTSYSLDLGTSHTLGVGLRFLGHGDFTSYDENGNELNTFSATDLAINAAYATTIIPNWTGGLSVDLIHSSYEQYNSSAFALTGGVLYTDTENHFSLGVVIRNLGTQFSTYNGTREPMPLDIAVGITKKPDAFPAELTVTLRKLNDWNLDGALTESSSSNTFNELMKHVVLGSKFQLSESFQFTLGYNHYLHELNKTNENFDFAGLHAGVGFTIKKLHFDISRSSYSSLGGVTHLSFKIAL